MSGKTIVTYARDAWHQLHGLVCLYKPADLHPAALRQTVIGNISRDLNLMDDPLPRKNVAILGTVERGLAVRSIPNFAADPLVIGPRYLPNDVHCGYWTPPGPHTAGVTVVAINNANRLLKKLREAPVMKAFHIAGKLGIATDDFYIKGKVVEKSTFKHVTRAMLEGILAAMQANHQRTMFQHMGVHMQSQKAYELAAAGYVRPVKTKVPVVYGLSLVQFQPPYFTVEVHCMNENEEYLLALTHEVGLQCKSSVTCTLLRCIRHGPFTLDLALLRKHWTLESFLNNMSQCERLMIEGKVLAETPHLQDITEGTLDHRSSQ